MVAGADGSDARVLSGGPLVRPGLVVLVGGLDLSVPALITLGGVLTTSWAGADAGVLTLPILALVLGVCALVGLVNGIGVVLLKVPPFIMTMATSITVASAALGFTSGTPRGASPPSSST